MQKKRFLSVILALCLILTLLPTFALADESTFSDMPNDYSTTALTSAVANGLLKGTDGKILPNDNLTRAQMAAIIVRAFGATGTADLTGYEDVTADAWYAAELGSAVKMKVLQGDGTTMRPDASITRQEVFAVVARALKLDDGTAADLAAFSDAGSVASWAVGTTAAMVKAGYVHGSDGMLNPTANISRKDFAVIMDNVVKTYVQTAGVVTSVSDGNVMVNVPGVTLKDLTVNGNLIVGDGVGDGEVTLENVKVTGAMIVRGGGVNSIIIKGTSSVGQVIVSKVDGNVRIHVEGDANVDVVYVDDGKDDVIVEGTIAKLEVAASDVPVVVQNATIGEVAVTADKANVTVDKDSSVKTVTASGAEPTLTISGKVETLTATEDAAGAKIEVAKGAEVKTANVAAEGAAVTGAGTVTNANVSGNNVNVSTPGTTVTAAEGTTGVTAGDKEVKGGETTKTEDTPSSGGITGPTSASVTVYKAKLHDKSEQLADDKLVTNYSVSAVKWSNKDYVDVTVKGTDLEYHQNGENNNGYWIGFALEAPTGATKMKVAFASAQNSLALGNAVALESNVVDGKFGVAFYANLGDTSPKTWAMVQWFDKDDKAIGSAVTYHMDLSGVTTTAVAKIGNTSYNTLASAVAAADGNTVTLQKDVGLTAAITIDKSITLDLNGKTITAKGFNARAFTVDAADKEVTVVDSSTQKSGTIDADNGSFKVDAGTLNIGTETQFGGNFTNTVNNWGGIKAAADNVTINVYDAVITTINGACFAIEGGPNDVLNIYGGTFTQTGYYNHVSCCVGFGDGVKINIEGGDFTCTNGQSVLSGWNSGAVVTVKGGTFTATGTHDPSTSTYVLQIDPIPTAVDRDKAGAEGTYVAPDWTIEDGTFNGAMYVRSNDAEADFKTSLTITGGTFSDFSCMDYLGTNADVTVKLADDIDLTGPIDIDKSVRLDLAGYKITPSTSYNGGDYLLGVKYGGKLTIDDTSENKTGEINAGSHKSVYTAVKMTLKGETYSSSDAVLVVNGGTLIGYYYGVSGNGTRHHTDITINGGILKGYMEGDNLGIYHPQSGKLTINGGEIIGVTGLAIKSGILTITGGTIKGTGAKAEYSHNGSGFNSTGDALVVEACDYPGGLPVVVDISGGTFVSMNNCAVAYYQQSEDYKLVNEKFITGGTFSSNPSTYVATGYTAAQDNGTWTVAADTSGDN